MMMAFLSRIEPGLTFYRFHFLNETNPNKGCERTVNGVKGKHGHLLRQTHMECFC